MEEIRPSIVRVTSISNASKPGGSQIQGAMLHVAHGLETSLILGANVQVKCV